MWRLTGTQYIGGAFGTVPFGVTGIFAALDMHTNRLIWQQEWPERCYSGSVATAGGLVFVGRSDGRLTALDSSTGALLWAFQTGAGVNATVSVFEQAGSSTSLCCRPAICLRDLGTATACGCFRWTVCRTGRGCRARRGIGGRGQPDRGPRRRARGLPECLRCLSRVER